MSSRIERVEFKVEGSKIVGNLHIPSTWNDGRACVVAGPMTSVKEQVTGVYAKELAKNGVLSLSIDHRHYGESDGEPRQFEYFKHKIEDLLASVDFLSQIEGVNTDKLGIFGICLGCGYSAGAAVLSDKVSWLGFVVGYYRDPVAMKENDPQGFEAKVDQGQQARLLYEKTGENQSIPAVSLEADAAMTLRETYEYYAKDWAVPNYKNEFSIMSREHFLGFNVQEFAHKITVPIVMVHSEKALSPHLANSFYQKLRNSDKEIFWLSSKGQVDFYSREALVRESISLILDGEGPVSLSKQS